MSTSSALISKPAKASGAPGTAHHALEVSGVIVLALLLTAWMTWPFAVEMGSHSIERGDSLLNAYLHAWGVHALLTHPSELFNANIFYPAKNTFALSENLLGNQIFFAPIYLITGNPNLGNNVVALLSFVLCFIAMYLLVRWATGNFWAGLIAGTIFAFAPARVGQFGHNQLLTFEWLPLIVLFLFRFLWRSKKRDLVAFAGCVFLQILCSLYLGYFALLVAVSYFLAIVLTRHQLLRRSALWQLTLAAVIVAGLLFPVLRPYRELQRGALRQDYRLQVSASANPLGSYLDTYNRPYGNLLHRFHSGQYDWEKQLWVGFFPLGLALLGVLSGGWRHKRTSASDEMSGSRLPFLLGSLLLTVTAYVLSLGPVLHIHDTPSHWRLPFLLLCKIVPGFATFRAPARFGILVMFGLSVFAGLGIAFLGEKLAARRGLPSPYVQAVVAAILVIAICHEYRYAPFAPPPAMTPANLSSEYRWLAKQPPDGAVLELPIVLQNGVPNPYIEVSRVYASAFHWHPLVNGYSGYAPPSAPAMYALAEALPSAQAADLLNGLGVHYVLVHGDEMSPQQKQLWSAAEPAQHLRRIAQFAATTVFELFGSDCEIGVENSPAQVVPSEVKAPAQGFQVILNVKAGSVCWVDSADSGKAKLVAEWKNQATGRVRRTVREINWPLYLQAGTEARATAWFWAPRQAGTYLLTFRLQGSPRPLLLRPLTLYDGKR